MERSLDPVYGRVGRYRMASMGMLALLSLTALGWMAATWLEASVLWPLAPLLLTPFTAAAATSGGRAGWAQVVFPVSMAAGIAVFASFYNGLDRHLTMLGAGPLLVVAGLAGLAHAWRLTDNWLWRAVPVYACTVPGLVLLSGLALGDTSHTLMAWWGLGLVPLTVAGWLLREFVSGADSEPALWAWEQVLSRAVGPCTTHRWGLSTSGLYNGWRVDLALRAAVSPPCVKVVLHGPNQQLRLTLGTEVMDRRTDWRPRPSALHVQLRQLAQLADRLTQSPS